MAKHNLSQPHARTRAVSSNTALRIAAGTGLVVTFLATPIACVATAGVPLPPQTQPATQPAAKPPVKGDPQKVDGDMAVPQVHWQVLKEPSRS